MVNSWKQRLENWSFRESNSQEWLEATVPGCVHTDLLHNNKIPDPFYGTNERDLQWIDKKDWDYETSFDLQEDLLKQKKVELVFEGLDTYADVHLNGEKVLFADNMFRTWKMNVTSLLQEKNNKLTIHFYSPIREGLTKLNELGYNLPATNDDSNMGGLGDNKLSVFTRKAPYHYGWDWGPRFVTSGIWKNVWIEGFSDCRINDMFIQQKEVTSEVAKVTAFVDVESLTHFEGLLEISTDRAHVKQPVRLSPGNNKVALEIEITNPKLWWSRGLGQPTMTHFQATLLKDDKVIASKTVKTGLRSLKLIRKDDPDNKGQSFYFEINGVPIFAKGANHIPNDSFLTRPDYNWYKREIVSAAESNMNMIRVWGGGIYEYDDFYDLCDDYGILVWQDFMFACSMYPGNEAFLESVKKEAQDNVKRLRYHPSIALWCGNNEMDGAWAEYDENGGWGWKQQYMPEQRQKLWHDYEAIFHDILPEVVNELAPEAYYWPSSPMSVWSNDGMQHSSFETHRGDIHYWEVWHGQAPFEDYSTHIGRFMSEYGFQSFPEEQTVRTYAEEEDMALESDVMLLHQKNGSGNRLIKEYMDQYFMPVKDFPSFLYMSQVQQAEAIKMAIEAHRRHMPYCMGSLYWQLNDCWPVASWSSMDYYGRWKALQYYAKRSFKDTALSFEIKNQEVQLFVITDQLASQTMTLHLKLIDFKGNIHNEWKDQVTVEGQSSTVVWHRAEKDILGSHLREQVFLYATVKTQDGLLDEKVFYFIPVKDFQLENPTISMTEANGELVLETDVLAKQVWLSAENEGIFSDNYFDLIPGIPKRVRFLQLTEESTYFEGATPDQVLVRSMSDFINNESN